MERNERNNAAMAIARSNAVNRAILDSNLSLGARLLYYFLDEAAGLEAGIQTHPTQRDAARSLVVNNLSLCIAARVLYLIFDTQAGDSGVFVSDWQTINRWLRHKRNVSQKRFDLLVKDLVDVGAIRIQPAANRQTTYVLTWRNSEAFIITKGGGAQ